MRVDESFRNARNNIQSTLINSHATLVLVWPGHESWENSRANSRSSTLVNSHATLVLVWPGHESWENSHANSRFSTLINSHATLVLVWLGHESWENSDANSHFSTLINFHACILKAHSKNGGSICRVSFSWVLMLFLNSWTVRVCAVTYSQWLLTL
jgi:hypothetical protein